MSAKRIAVVVLIYVLTCIGWFILSGVNTYRSDQTYDKLESGGMDTGRAAVQDLWGQPQTQIAPSIWTTHVEKSQSINEKGEKIWKENTIDDPVVPSHNKLDVNLEYEPRRKGLLWYSTYKVRYSGEYTFSNSFADERKFYVKLQFPAGQAMYDNVELEVNGRRVDPAGDLSGGVQTWVKLAPGASASVKMAYGSQGLDTWKYKFGRYDSVSSVKDFTAKITTNTKEIDFPPNCISPTEKNETGDGWELTWKYGSLVSGYDIGIKMPQKLNPGPFSARLSLFAPISLLFFFSVLLILGTVKGVNLHPVHYLFLSAAFFSFHLLFSYMVDHVAPFYSFLISSAVSLLLVVSYMRLVTGWDFAVKHTGLWQFIFLVLFTYAFFFPGYTGLTITIGAILTLAVMMQITGRINWDERLRYNGK